MMNNNVGNMGSMPVVTAGTPHSSAGMPIVAMQHSGVGQPMVPNAITSPQRSAVQANAGGIAGNGAGGYGYETKVRVPGQLISRLIGKSGSSVKRLMEETGTHISINDTTGQEAYPSYGAYDPAERLVVIRAPTSEAVAHAEKRVFQKLQSFYDADLNTAWSTAQQQQQAYPPTAAMGAMSLGGQYGAQPLMASSSISTQHGYAGGAYPLVGNGTLSIPSAVSNQQQMSTGSLAAQQQSQQLQAANYSQPLYFYSQQMPQGQTMCMPATAAASQFQYYPMQPQPLPFQQDYPLQYANASSFPAQPRSQTQIKVRLYAPNSLVGTLIGSRGSNIRAMISTSKANIHIDSQLEHDNRMDAIRAASGASQPAAQTSVPLNGGEGKSEQSPGGQPASEEERNSLGEKNQAVAAADAGKDEKKVVADVDGAVNDKCHTGGGVNENASGFTTSTTGEKVVAAVQTSSSGNLEDGGSKGASRNLGDNESENVPNSSSNSKEGSAKKDEGMNATSKKKEDGEENRKDMEDGAKPMPANAEEPKPANSQEHEEGRNKSEAVGNARPNADEQRQGRFAGGRKCPPNDSSDEDRCVTITGFENNVFNAAFQIFQRVAEGNHVTFNDCSLTCEQVVPTVLIGRIIGKSGQNVKELQHSSRARIHVPHDLRRGPGIEAGPNETTAVKIIGNWYSVQAVLIRFTTLIAELEQTPRGSGGGYQRGGHRQHHPVAPLNA